MMMMMMTIRHEPANVSLRSVCARESPVAVSGAHAYRDIPRERERERVRERESERERKRER